MSSARLHRLVAIAALVLAACASSGAPQLKVIGVERAHRDSRGAVLFVEVVNRAPRAMRLERLQYTFGADAQRTARGDIALDRTVDAGAAVIVQVPVDLSSAGATPGETLMLHGELSAHENDLERTFTINASVIAPEASASGWPPVSASETAPDAAPAR
ncbi:MAG: hypothetical protein K8W52_27095 [Deltaproteobacteria bacterium]|nr:hypothetical protein [Deltaproteobacteria bacterium]